MNTKQLIENMTTNLYRVIKEEQIEDIPFLRDDTIEIKLLKGYSYMERTQKYVENIVINEYQISMTDFFETYEYKWQDLSLYNHEYQTLKIYYNMEQIAYIIMPLLEEMNRQIMCRFNS